MGYRADQTPPRRFRRLRHGRVGQLVPDEHDATPPPLPRLCDDNPKGWSRALDAASVARCLFPPDEDLFGVDDGSPLGSVPPGVALRPSSAPSGQDRLEALRVRVAAKVLSPRPPPSWRSSACASEDRTTSKKQTAEVTTEHSDAASAGDKPGPACGTWSGSRYRLSRSDSESSCEGLEHKVSNCSTRSEKPNDRLSPSSQDVSTSEVSASQEVENLAVTPVIVPERQSLAVAAVLEGHKKPCTTQFSPVPERLRAETELRQGQTSEALRQQEEELGREKETIRKMLQEVKKRGAEFRTRKEELRRRMHASIPDAPMLRKRARDSSPKGQGQFGEPAAKRSKNIAGLEDAEADALINFSPGAYAPPFVIRRLVGEDPCAICLDPLYSQALTISICGHIFHKSCLDTAGTTSCPQCRRPVDTDRPKVLRNLARGVLRDLKILVPPNYREIPFRQLSQTVNRHRGLSGPPFADRELIDAISALSREHRGAVVIEKGLVICTW